MVVEDYKEKTQGMKDIKEMTLDELYDLREQIAEQIAVKRTGTVRDAMDEIVAAIIKAKEIVKQIEDNNGEDDADLNIYFSDGYCNMSIYDMEFIALSEWQGADIGKPIAIPKF